MGDYTVEEYHEGWAPWRSTHNYEGPLVGIELEVEGVGGRHKILEAIPDTDIIEERPLVEEDSSLSYMDGVEIIFPPVDPRKLTLASSFFSKTLKALSKVELRNRDNAGLHINVNTFGWPARKELLFVALFHFLPARAIQNLGGRSLNSYCGQCKAEDFGGYLNSDMHSYAAELKDGEDRVELRFPKTTTDIKRVRVLLTFAGVAASWAEQTNISTSYTTTDKASQVIRADFSEYLEGLRNTAAIKKMKEVMENGYT